MKKIVFNDKDINNGVCVAVGTFDGVHLGHRAMISALVDAAKEKNLAAAVFTFDTDDNPKSDRKMLATESKKLSLFASLGVDVVFSAPFSQIRAMSSVEFVERVLYAELNAKTVVCGYDFRFGCDRSGDFVLIKELLSPKGVEVITQPAVTCNSDPVSSTLIRELISKGDIVSANKLLGRPFSINSEVVCGARIGRTLGFPTANQVYPTHLAVLRYGVYAVRCRFDGAVYDGVANVGMKPTVANTDLPLCETYLFDFDGDCYGKNIETEFIAFIREEKRFSSLEELKKQIERDKNSAKEILKGDNRI